MVKLNNVPKLIDHTLLKADVSPGDIEKLCREALQYSFCSVCVNPVNVKLAADMLRGSDVKVCTVVGFPLGADLALTKAYQTSRAIEQGAREIDMVINLGAVKGGDFETVRREIMEVIKAAGDGVVKVIIETCYLTDAEKVKLCKLVSECGGHFVKTSTGFGTGGATVQDVRLMRQAVGSQTGVKASGGIRDLKTLLAMVEAGANRIGTSSGVKIMEEVNKAMKK